MDSKRISVAMSGLSWASGDVPGGLGSYSGEQIMDEIALAGFTGAEAGPGFPRDAQVLRPMLDLRGLIVPSGWFGSFLLTKPYEEVEKEMIARMDNLRASGGNIINMSEQSYSIQTKPEIGTKDRYIMNDAEWDRLTDGFIKLSKVATDNGFTIAYHHHMGTVIQSAEDVDRMMEATKGSDFALLVDTGHAVFANIDPTAMFEKHAARVKNIHLKDVRYDIMNKALAENMSFVNAILAGVFGCPGDGNFDFPTFFKAVEKSDYAGWLIVEAEQDPSIYHPLTCAKRTRAYIKEHTGV